MYESLLEFRKAHSISGLRPDGSDVVEFEEMMKNTLNVRDSTEISALETQKRKALEGEGTPETCLISRLSTDKFTESTMMT